jgi:diaminohydroxyphosphoribosylaminopyrimidine deaminase/5-amino-6-(5-phosphoribosylamino)uracil reductase
MDKNIIYMKRAIELASLAGNRVNPNPRVGCVIVKKGRIVGEGYHEYFGGPHAEVNALSAAGSKARGARMYVTLEPCCHYGKTLPCTDAILGAGIKEVIVASEDPNALMRGKSINLLRRNKIKVTTGLLEKTAVELNRPYNKYMKSGLPFITLKAAMTIDGKIASISGDSKWITCRQSRNYVHKLRSLVDAVLTGVNTVLKDDPALTSRIKGKEPLRIVVDSDLRMPLSSKMIAYKKGEVLIATCSSNKHKLKMLIAEGVKIIKTKRLNGMVDLKELMRLLAGVSITSILVEGGGSINASFLEQGLVDRVVFFIAPKIIGGSKALSPVEGGGIRLIRNAIKLNDIDVKRFGNDVMIEGYINRR